MARAVTRWRRLAGRAVGWCGWRCAGAVRCGVRCVGMGTPWDGEHDEHEGRRSSRAFRHDLGHVQRAAIAWDDAFRHVGAAVDLDGGGTEFIERLLE